MNKALFLDRDGTLIIDVPYLHDPAKIQIIEGTKRALEKAKEMGYLLFLFTNQSGIGRGMYKIEDARTCNRRMIEMLDLGPGLFTDICIAPEHPDEPPIYRKPEPKFILEMVAKHSLSQEYCYMVGDRLSDTQVAFNSNIQPIRVETGKAMASEEEQWLQEGKLKAFNTFANFVDSLS